MKKETMAASIAMSNIRMEYVKRYHETKHNLIYFKTRMVHKLTENIAYSPILYHDIYHELNQFFLSSYTSFCIYATSDIAQVRIWIHKKNSKHYQIWMECVSFERNQSIFIRSMIRPQFVMALYDICAIYRGHDKSMSHVTFYDSYVTGNISKKITSEEFTAVAADAITIVESMYTIFSHFIGVTYVSE